MKQFLILIFMVGLWPLCGKAQLIVVKDQINLERVPGVLVKDDSGNLVRTTRADGTVDISGFGNAQTIFFEKPGFETAVFTYSELAGTREVFLKKDPLALGEIVVSANRWEQNKDEVPNRITSVTKKEIALQNPQTSADLLGFSNEVFVQKSQLGGGSPMIRGFSTNRLLISVDGVRMNTAIFRGGNLQNVISIDPLAVDRAEVIFGPGSVIYGSDAIGGVMSFYTLEPEFSGNDEVLATGSALARYASANNERTGHFDINLGWKKWASVTSFSYSKFGDLKMGSNGPGDYLVPVYVARVDSQDVVVGNPDPEVQTPTGYEQINLMQKIRFAPAENWDLQYSFHYSATSDYARFDRHRRVRNGHPRYGEWYYGPQVWMMNNFRMTHRSGNVLYDEVSLNIAQQHFEESRNSRNFGSLDLENNEEQVEAYSVNLDFEKGDEDPHRVFYGLEAILNKVASTGKSVHIYTGESTPLPSRYPDGSTWSSYAAYASYEFVPGERWSLQAGARYNLYSIKADFNTAFYPFPFENADLQSGALTGSLGAVFSPDPGTKIRANLSTGFRAPNIDDIGKLFESVEGAVVVPNPGLRAEYAYNAEIGMAKVFNKILKLDVTAYYTILQHAQVRRPFTFNGEDSIVYKGEPSQVLAIQNAAQARVYGVQAGLNFRLPAGFALEAVYNYQQGEEEQDDGTTAPLRHAAPPFGVIRLAYANDRTQLDLYANFNQEVSYEDLAPSEREKTEIYAADANGNPYTPAWYTLNFKAAYQLNSGLLLTAGLENITDQRYLPYSSGVVAAGRNFILGLKARF